MCTTTTGYKAGANAAGVTLPGIGTIGAVTTQVRSSKSGSTKTSTTVSETAGLNVLGGLVSASAIKTVATASKTKSGYKTTGKTTLTGLSIAGIPVSVTPAKNSTVTIPLIATVTLNEQSPSSKYGNRGISVVGLRIKLFPGNPLGLPTGSIAVGISKASIHSAVNRRPYGSAYGTQISVGGLLKSGPTAAVYLPCGGSSNSTLTNSVATADLTDLIDAGVVKTTAKSTDSKAKTVATTSAKVAGIDLLDGLITVDAITSKATATRKGKKLTVSSDGTKLVGLKVNGQSYSASVKANTKIDILGVGTLYLRRVVKSGSGVSVYGVYLKLSVAVGDHPEGTVVTVAAAKAGVKAT